jgi:hypothetical protein
MINNNKFKKIIKNNLLCHELQKHEFVLDELKFDQKCHTRFGKFFQSNCSF